MTTKLDFIYMGDLPNGYEYKVFKFMDAIKVIGIATDKEPIGFIYDGKALRRISWERNNDDKL